MWGMAQGYINIAGHPGAWRGAVWHGVARESVVEARAGNFHQELFAQGRDRWVCQAHGGDCAGVEVVGEGHVCGVGDGCGRCGVEDQGGVCGGAGCAVSCWR